MATALRHGPIEASSLHVCVDMQVLFANGSPWQVPWFEKTLPRIEMIVGAHTATTIFTRFLPPNRPADAVAMWRRYYERWRCVTLERIDPGMIEIAPELAGYSPPAETIDKTVYSPWTEGRLDALLSRRPATTLIITGAETDVCVLATVLGAVDRGFRTIIASDAICSSADETHDALLKLYSTRFSEQIELATSADILANWTGRE
ncbi:cysteine hydrolase [Mesorhizobium sp. NPDC059054]|uniref:cysteine hydrolase n=1 Tax=Mesorhizobium sp. NPDC059054 TaxID=3346711 RepID=UPI0036B209F9